MFFKKNKNQMNQLSDWDNDFPALIDSVSGDRVVYFDNACVTLRPWSVIKEIEKYYTQHPSCSRRSPHTYGQRTTVAIDEARAYISNFVGTKNPSELIFTKNATEAINLVANGMSFSRDDIIVTSNLEHNSNLLPWMRLEEKIGLKHLTWEITPDGQFNLDNLFQILEGGKVRLLSLFMTSHILGIRLPLEQIIEKAHKYNCLVLIDAAQSLFHEKVNVRDIGCDFMAFSFHKALGPSGVGALYIKSDHVDKIYPSVLGGETVDNVKFGEYHLSQAPYCYEPGLQDYSGIMGAKKALEYITSIGYEKIQNNETKVFSEMFRFLASFPDVEILGAPDLSKHSSLINFIVKGMPSDELAIMLDKTGKIMCRSGVHCSHAWYQLYEKDPSLRVSFAFYNTLNDVEKFKNVFSDLMKFHKK